MDETATLPQLLRDSARLFGDSDFIVAPSGTMSFCAADQRSGELACRLLGLGIGKGTHVGLLLPQNADFVVALLAVARIGAIAIPLSTFCTPRELRRTVRHADVHLLIVSSGLFGRDEPEFLREAFPSLSSQLAGPMFLDEAPYLRWIGVVRNDASSRLDLISSPDAGPSSGTRASDELLDRVEAEVRPSDRFVIVYTSGSTAEPKGVVHTHGAQIRHSKTLARLYGITSTERTVTNMPFFWIGGLTVVLLANLHSGGAVILLERLDTAAALDFLEQVHPTRCIGWMLLEKLQADPTFPTRHLDLLVLSSPGRFTTDPGLRHSGLGMTETGGPHSLVGMDEAEDVLDEAHRGSFGRVAPGVERKIVDPDSGATQPEGELGEICVRGPILMQGIHKREREDVFDVDGWYHTRDLGRERDGLLIFEGRLNDMIKSGGANVSPAEVQDVIRGLPAVATAFVLSVPDDQRGEVVGAIVCPRPGVAIDPEGLKQELRTHLSSYKVPRRVAVMRLEDVPFLPTHKPDRRELVRILEAQGPTGPPGAT